MSSLPRRVCATASLIACSPVAGLAENGMHSEPNPVMILAFGLLLLAIAIIPFINRHWWERYYPHVSVGLGLVVVVYYIAGPGNPVRVLHAGIEYVSFICLIGSLFVVAGGIHIRIRGKSTPLRNVFLLAVGAVVSNIIGTTGASMILIRPFLRVNQYRVRPHHVVFFIFIVSNMGGALTPIGDPPLFLGYLKGIPFFWVAEHLWYKWAIGIVAVLSVFYLVDGWSFRKVPPSVREEAGRSGEEGEASGIQNVFFIVVILVAVFVTDPPFVREALMICAAAGSYFTTRKEIHRKNDFNFLPVKEVAILFLGIFATMMPALDWLELNATGVGLQHASQFYWATGALSSFLDNAPTYLSFLSAAIGLFVNEETVKQVYHLVQTQGADLAQLVGPSSVEIKNTFATLMKYHSDMVASGHVSLDDINVSYLIGNHNIFIQAISIAAVFFGACTYIGNGPNFMVKSIAERSGVPCPSFFGYIAKYTVPVLLPVFGAIWLLYFHGQ